ncbi:40S ribosomal protein S25, putative [Plasmodium chabaudi adami]|uniref:40S ribosomal protein S25 n=1 Tax=Plasmodium chabaudi adami TaxID=5826 RepID=A0A1D3LKF0_PLACE|nr:40S ribosomal protein S25, putative [Plasmodium chabaudi adami]
MYTTICINVPPKERKTKEQIAAAAAASGRSKKKKWGKGKNKEKLNHAVFIDKSLQSKILEVQNMKVITPSTISDKYKVNLSVARAVIKYLAEKNLIKEVCIQSHCQKLYTKVA